VLVATLFDVKGAELAVESIDVAVAAHSGQTLSVDGLFGGFRDLSYAYRFGPLAVDVVSLQLCDTAGTTVAETCFLPGGHARALVSDVGLAADARRNNDGTVDVRVSAPQFAQFVSLELSGHDADQNWFHLAPGGQHSVRFTAAAPGRRSDVSAVDIRALNSRAVASAIIA
jgi:beta-mannosidase